MSILDGVTRLQASLDYHLERHNVLASNLAEMNTPGFRPKDLERASFAEQMHAAMAVTNEKHLHGSNKTNDVGTVVDDPSAPVGGDGNAVSLDREAVKIAANQVRYDAITGLVGGKLASLVWAATDGRSG